MKEALKAHFGHEEFLPGQEEIVKAVLEGKDAFFRLPTGGGKSLCYQLPSLIDGKSQIVLSPLIALMRDQVRALGQKGISAMTVHSNMTAAERSANLAAIESGRVRFIYAAPEQFYTTGFQDAIKKAGVSRATVDEAHCVSHWGLDFRPVYQELRPLLEELKISQVLACTATASTLLKDDVVDSLQMKNPFVYMGDLYRPNLKYSVQHCDKPQDKMRQLLSSLESTQGNKLIYCSTRKQVMDVYDFLKNRGLSLSYYHAGLEVDERIKAQRDFFPATDATMVSTNAFGMGIDKPDIRLLVHFDIPGSVEAYLQESGRAGRDGKDSQCTLLVHPKDLTMQRRFLESLNPEIEVVRYVYDQLNFQREKMGKKFHEPFIPNLQALETQTKSRYKKLGVFSVTPVLALLSRLGVLKLRGKELAIEGFCDTARLLDSIRQKLSHDQLQFNKIKDYANNPNSDQSSLINLLD